MTYRPWRLLCIAVLLVLGAGACGSETVVAEPAAEGPQPTLSINIEADKKSGQNVQLTTTDFAFTPESVGSEDVAHEGYVQLLVDDNDPIRIYSDWVHLSLAPGEHNLRAELVTNSGDIYDGGEATGMITVPDVTDGGHQHSADPIEFVGDAPEMALTVTEDPTHGWNVHAEITNFRFAPEHVSGENVDGEGHLHLYVNGVKIQRLYGNWWHLPELAGGENIITVEANANDHTPYLVNGEVVDASATVVGTGDAMQDDDADDHDSDNTDDPDNDGMPDGALMVDVGFVGGDVTGIEGRVDVELGQTVMLRISSDVAEHVHVHGYDIFLDVGPDQEGTLMFEANVPGVFEIEFEDSGLLVTELEVR